MGKPTHIRDILNKMFKPKNDKYQSYLNSIEWKAIKTRLFQEPGKQCEKCGSYGNIQVHHITYVRIFKERLSDLMVVCNKCHAKIHANQ